MNHVPASTLQDVDFRYNRLFIYSSLQFCGHIEEYFAAHTRFLVVFIVLPRVKATTNLVRLYQEGRLIKEYQVASSPNFFLFYLLWLINHWLILFRHFSRSTPFFFLAGHPICFFGMKLQKILRPATFAYGIGDYFPSASLIIRAFERLKQFYHDRIPITFYLSDAINQQMNGKLLSTRARRTVMWGMKLAEQERLPPRSRVVLLFVGVVKNNQGLEMAYSFLATHPNYDLKIIGPCEDSLFAKHTDVILAHGIRDRVWFPNRSLFGSEFEELTRDCHIGLALYDLSPDNFTHYADPGKVKMYLEMGLPVVMTNISCTAQYVQRFGCGEVIRPSHNELAAALERIERDYHAYQEGVSKFSRHFFYEDYYTQAFAIFEKHDHNQ